MACRTIMCMKAIERMISASNDTIKARLSSFFLLDKQEMKIVEMSAGLKSSIAEAPYLSYHVEWMDDMLNPAVPALQSQSKQRSAAQRSVALHR